jgi:uncharacterized repeat protein (TIGR04076 family)
MPNLAKKCKITVLKRIACQDIADEYMGQDYKEMDMMPCPYLKEGQEFISDNWGKPPEGFCGWAWADIHKYIIQIMSGGNFNTYVEKKGVAIACCTDGFRPVVFKIERIEE